MVRCRAATSLMSIGRRASMSWPLTTIRPTTIAPKRPKMRRMPMLVRSRPVLQSSARMTQRWRSVPEPARSSIASHKPAFAILFGIEPSTAAIDAAPAHRRTWIREGIFEGSDFPPESFDLICCFMTLEHVQDPGALVAAAHRLLRPGGVFVGVTHNRRAWLDRFSAVARRSSTSSICSCSRRAVRRNCLRSMAIPMSAAPASGTATARLGRWPAGLQT